MAPIYCTSFSSRIRWWWWYEYFIALNISVCFQLFMVLYKKALSDWMCVNNLTNICRFAQVVFCLHPSCENLYLFITSISYFMCAARNCALLLLHWRKSMVFISKVIEAFRLIPHNSIVHRISNTPNTISSLMEKKVCAHKK